MTKTTTVTVNPATMKEETIMKKKTNDYTLNGKVAASTWNEFVKAMRDAGLKTGHKKFQELVDEYNALNVTDETIVSVGDLEITHDKMVIEEPTPEAKSKTNKLFANIHGCGVANKAKGFGYTISSFMLQWAIINAFNGLGKLKGHTVTNEEHQVTNRCFKWLKDNGYIVPAVYSVIEDDNVRVYIPEVYSGSNDTKIKMVPYNKSAGYTAKAITSFALTDKFKGIFA